MGATDGRVRGPRSPRGHLRGALVTACGVLGIAGAPARATEVDTGMLGYVEPGRVSAWEVIGNGRHEFADGKAANFRFVFDALTGSSANGAVPSSGHQTFTSPSGGSSYTTAPGETPLDDTFSDRRVALSGGLTLPWGRLTKVDAGLYGSFETDYTSLGVNAALTRDLNRRNTTITLRAARFEDTVSPMGGAPVGLAPMPPPRPGDGEGEDDEGEGGDYPGESKNVTDVGVGVSQVLDARTVLSLNYTRTRVGGYQTDPYKLVSVVDPVSGAPRATDPYLYEKRPDLRHKNAFAITLVRHLARDIATLSYRYYDDDWQVRSHTWDLKYRLNYRAGRHLTPHLRWYRQDGADFYARYLLDGGPLPAHATADYRLGDMHAVTLGVTHGTVLRSGHVLTVRLEYYAQMGDSKPADAVGELRNYDLFPTVDAWILNVGYSFGR